MSMPVCIRIHNQVIAEMARQRTAVSAAAIANNTVLKYRAEEFRRKLKQQQFMEQHELLVKGARQNIEPSNHLAKTTIEKLK